MNEVIIRGITNSPPSVTNFPISPGELCQKDVMSASGVNAIMSGKVRNLGRRGSEVKPVNQFHRLVAQFLADGIWHRGDGGFADGIEGDAFLDFAAADDFQEIDRAHLAVGADQETDRLES